MATKGRPQDTRWLAGWKEVESSATVALDPLNTDESMHECLIGLTQLGYIVRISGVVGNYQVQCINLLDTPYRLKEPVGLSYTGASLIAILRSAAYEADLIAAAPGNAEYRIGERARWVQS